MKKHTELEFTLLFGSGEVRCMIWWSLSACHLQTDGRPHRCWSSWPTDEKLWTSQDLAWILGTPRDMHLDVRLTLILVKILHPNTRNWSYVCQLVLCPVALLRERRILDGHQKRTQRPSLTYCCLIERSNCSHKRMAEDRAGNSLVSYDVLCWSWVVQADQHYSAFLVEGIGVHVVYEIQQRCLCEESVPVRWL